MTNKKLYKFDVHLKEKLKNKDFKILFEQEGFYLSVGCRIAKLRDKKGLSENTLAKRLRISRKTLDAYMVNPQNMTLETIQKIAEILHRKSELRFV
jgi:predicted transcriptional regulator